MNSRLTLIVFAALCAAFLTPSVANGQKNKANLEQAKSLITNGFEQTNTGDAWLAPPYLNKAIGEATVGELTQALQRYQSDNANNLSALEKNPAFRRFQKQVYFWQLTGRLDEIPANAAVRIKSFMDYQHTLAPQPEQNPDANWRLLGPSVDPAETGFSIEGVSNNEAVLTNTGLGRITCVEFSRWNDRNIWVGTASGGLWKSWDGGQNWANISLNLPIMEITDVAVDQQNDNTIYIATGDRDGNGGWYGKGTRSSLYKTTDGGNSWTQVLGNFNGSGYIEHLWMHPKMSNILVIVKANGVYRTDDAGATWLRTLSTAPFIDGLTYADATYNGLSNSERIYAGYFADNAGSKFFKVLKSDNFGQTWTATDTIKGKINSGGFKAQYVRMNTAPSDANCLYVLSSEYDQTARSDRFGVLFRTLDAGGTWFDRSDYPSVPNVLGRYLGDATDLTSGGNYALMLAVDRLNKDRVYVSGSDMWASANGGTSFTKMTFSLNSLGESAHGEHHVGKFQFSTGAFFLATDGGLFKAESLQIGNQSDIVNCANPLSINGFRTNCTSFGTRWNFASNGLSNTEFYSIAVSKSNPDFIMGGADGNGTIMRKNGRWQGAFGGEGTTALIHPRDTNTFYVTVGGGAIYKTINGGRTFRYQSRLMDSLDAGAWVTPMDMSDANPNLIIQGRNKNVWRTANGGANWVKISNFPQGNAVNLTHSVAVAPSASNVIFVARTTQDSNATIQRYLWRTDNGGIDWVNVFDVLKFPADGILTDILIGMNDPDKIWVTFSVGYTTNTSQSKKVFVSTDGGANWTNMTEGLPSAPVWTIATQQKNPKEPIYVGTSVGVFYRDNTLNSFVEWQVGMPKGIMVADLKVHEATKKVYAGTFGRGIWVADSYDSPVAMPENTQKTTPQYPKQELGISPNPSRGTLSITLKSGNAQGLEVTDLAGKTVFTQNQFTDFATVDLSNLPNGLYLLKVKTDKEWLIKKFILSK